MATATARTEFPHITTDPNVCHGRSCIAGTRVRVMDIVAAHEEACGEASLPSVPTQSTATGRVNATLTYHGSVATLIEDAQNAEWRADFEAAARRSLRTRFRYSFLYTYKPVLDDAEYRSFDTTAAYREWCERHLPPWLGYGPAV